LAERNSPNRRFWGPNVDADVNDEVQYHLDMRVQYFVDRGLSLNDARRAALDAFGDVQEVTRALSQHDRRLQRRHRRAEMFHSLVSDLRYALRRARARPGFTAVAVFSLAIGIGANTAAFTLVNAILFHKTPVQRPDRVVDLYNAHDGQVYGPLSYPDYADLRARSSGVFSAFSISKFTNASRDLQDRVETIPAELVNGDFFPLIGLPPALGRLLEPSDDVARGAHPVVVLGYDYWRTSFNGDPSILGQQLRLSGRMYTVVGVASKRIQGLLPGLAPAVYIPVQMTNQIEPGIEDALTQRGDHAFFARARLADGQPLAAAQYLSTQFVSAMRKLHPSEWSNNTTLRVIPLSDITVNPLVDRVVVPAASALMIVVALVLIIACANLASFLLAQARDRRREIAIRLAIGATRAAIVRQLLAESVVLAALGGACGVALGYATVRILLHVDLPLPIPVNLDAGIDMRVLAVAITASFAAAAAFGLVPALQASRPEVVETIKNENSGGKGRSRLTLRNALVVGQAAMSLTLLIVAGLFLRSFAAESKIDAGFGSQPAAVTWMAIPADRYPGERWTAMLNEVERRVGALPGVRSVGAIDNMMLNSLNESSRYVNVDGFAPPRGEPGFDIAFAAIDSGFFGAAGVQLLRGRGILPSDTKNAPRVAVINEVMARQFWPNQSAVGRTFKADTTAYVVIGVSRTTKVNSIGEAARPLMFYSLAQSPSSVFTLVARSEGNAEQTALRIVATLRELDPALIVIQSKTMARHLETVVLPAKLGAAAFATFAGLALVLAITGIYGVVRYAVARRSREVAIRLALGAAPSSVVRLVMAEGLILVVAGLVGGLGLGLITARGLQGLLYGTRVTEPLTFIGAPLLLLVAAIIAAYLPARRASRLDPVSTLRAE
jgi:putative ABC transport system permease protein